MTIEQKKELITIGIVFGGAFLISYMVRPNKLPKAGKKFDNSLDNETDRTNIPLPQLPDDISANPKAESAYMALTAYLNAYNEGVPKQELRDLNAEISNELGLKVYRKDHTKLAVKDLNDKDIIFYNT
jgi:energy-converting hydrogenase Eha subunit F